MPQVPDQFVPSATVSPLGVSPVSATAVQPMRNAAPGQMQQSGADTQKLGEVTNDIGERIQNQLDNAMAKQADTKFSQAVDTVMNGDGTDANQGFVHTQAQDTIDAYPGASDALAKAKQSIADGLADPFQKSLFNRVASQRLVNAGNLMNDHLFVQKKQFALQSAVDRAQSFVGPMADAGNTYGQVDANTGAPTGEFYNSLKAGEAETLTAASLNGAPAGSATANKALLNYHSQIAVTTLSQMMDAPQASRPAPETVQGIFDDMNAKGWLDPNTKRELGKLVKSYADGEVTHSVSIQTLSDAARAAEGQPTSANTPDIQNPVKGSTMTAQPYDPEKGGVELTIPQNSAVQAPADGTVTGLGKNDNDVPYLELTHKDGSVSTLTGLNTYSVKMGDQVRGGQTIATSGVSDSPNTPSVLWSLADKDGNAADPTRAGLAPVNLHSITDEKVLDSALTAVRQQIADPKLQDEAAREITTFVKGNQQQLNALQTQNYKQASDAFYQGGMNWRSIPPSVFNQLPPERQQEFKDKQTEEVLKNYNQGQAFKEMSETDAVSYFIQNPAALTPTNVDKAMANGTLARSTYLQLMGKATELQNAPKGVEEATGIAERIKHFAGQAGMNVDDTRMNPDGSVVAAKPTAEDKQNYINLSFKVQADIDQIKAQNHGKATPDQVDKAITNELTQRTLQQPRSLWTAMTTFDDPGRMSGVQKRNFQLPPTTTGVAQGKDGKMHYTDATGKDLGVVQ